jgi:predicted RNA-binding Zn-ribbon protein involved in translation (DUF1610 family)
MAAEVTRCSGCEAVLRPDETTYEGNCAECAELHCPSLLDDPDVATCDRCEERVPVDEVDEDCVCSDCRDAEEDRRQLESDYRFWTR